ncbi:hypothetical protein [Mycetocola saprophilus]|uniref:hypothetical protein n=1 Tax=Mycetocola saprophilus TaxID=76636 RepID=UPI003BF192BA
MSGNTPLVLNGPAAARALVARGTVRAGWCLEEVDRAFGAPRSDRVMPYPNAAAALTRVRQLGALRTGPVSEAPEGAVLYYTFGSLGHIALKGAGGRVATIDFPTRGKSALVDPNEMARGWPSVRYVVYAWGPGAYLGNTVSVAVPRPPQPEPTPEGEFMPKIVHATSPKPGTIALISEFSARVYTAPGGDQGASIAVNGRAFGTVTGFTEAEVAILVAEAEARGSAMAAKIARAQG